MYAARQRHPLDAERNGLRTPKPSRSKRAKGPLSSAYIGHGRQRHRGLTGCSRWVLTDTAVVQSAAPLMVVFMRSARRLGGIIYCRELHHRYSFVVPR